MIVKRIHLTLTSSLAIISPMATIHASTGRCWDRTSDPLLVRSAQLRMYPCMKRRGSFLRLAENAFDRISEVVEVAVDLGVSLRHAHCRMAKDHAERLEVNGRGAKRSAGKCVAKAVKLTVSRQLEFLPQPLDSAGERVARPSPAATVDEQRHLTSNHRAQQVTDKLNRDGVKDEGSRPPGSLCTCRLVVPERGRPLVKVDVGRFERGEFTRPAANHAQEHQHASERRRAGTKHCEKLGIRHRSAGVAFSVRDAKERVSIHDAEFEGPIQRSLNSTDSSFLAPVRTPFFLGIYPQAEVIGLCFSERQLPVYGNKGIKNAPSIGVGARMLLCGCVPQVERDNLPNRPRNVNPRRLGRRPVGLENCEWHQSFPRSPIGREALSRWICGIHRGLSRVPGREGTGQGNLSTRFGTKTPASVLFRLSHERKESGAEVGYHMREP